MRHQDNSKNMVRQKKGYKSPVVHHYGTLESLTKSVLNGPGRIDNLKGQYKTA
jgi:hypothetical protein